MSGIALRTIVAAIGVGLCVLPLSWRSDQLGVALTAVGVTAAVAAPIARRDAVPTLVCAAAIGHVAASDRPVPAAGVVLLAVVLAGYLAAIEAGSIHRWRLPSAGLMRGYVAAPLAGVAAASVLALAGELPAPGGWFAAVFAALGCVAGAVLVVGATAALRRSLRDRT